MKPSAKKEKVVSVIKNIICFRSILESESANHSFAKRNPITASRIKIKSVFCKYKIPKTKVAKINAAGNLWSMFL